MFNQWFISLTILQMVWAILLLLVLSDGCDCLQALQELSAAGRTSVLFHMDLATWLLGLPHSMVVGFQKQHSQSESSKMEIQEISRPRKHWPQHWNDSPFFIFSWFKWFGWGFNSVAKHLPEKCEVLSLIPATKIFWKTRLDIEGKIKKLFPRQVHICCIFGH